MVTPGAKREAVAHAREQHGLSEAAALLTPFESCGPWILSEKPLRKPRSGWAFVNDPVGYPLAALDDDASGP